MTKRVDWYRWAVLAGLLAMVVLGFVLIGCARDAQADAPARFSSEPVASLGGPNGLRLLSDHDTGVQYLLTRNGDITPLLSSDGTPYLGGEVLG